MREQRIPITLVIVDAGPLISLAACSRLTLLECFHRKVLVTDVVQAECLRYPDRIGAAALRIWFEAADGQRYDIVDTPLLDGWQAAVRQEQAGDRTRPSRGLGDASISWLIQRIQSSPPNDEILLLLSDDAPFGDGAIVQRHPEVYMLSTRQLLQVLQNFDIIESAEQILAEIAEVGRSIPPYAADRPGKIMPGVKSQWTDALKGG